MSERKTDGTGELEDEQLSNVTGGASVAGDIQPPDPQDPALPDGSPSVTSSPRDAASGLPTGKRMHKPFVAG